MEKYGLYYQIHVIEECGINGAILASVQDCYHRVIGSGSDLNLPENNMKNVFLFHFSKITLIGYMNNSSGEFNGKFFNHVSNHINKSYTL